MIRAIEHAYSSENGERFSISENTNSQEERFALREEVQRKKRYFECIECGQFPTFEIDPIVNVNNLDSNENEFP